MNQELCSYRITQESDYEILLSLTGEWTVDSSRPDIDQLVKEFSGYPGLNKIKLQAASVNKWDSTFLIFLLALRSYAEEHNLSLVEESLDSGVVKLLHLATAVEKKKDAFTEKARQTFLSKVGSRAIQMVTAVTDILAFFGEIVVAIWELIRGKARLRLSDILLFIQDSGPAALPIITLTSFLVGVIFAYIGAIQLEQFGAQIYIANLVGIGMTREMGGLMAAVIMSGRTGAAYAAQLGTMQVNEEVDALTTLGMSPMVFLVLPRMLALVLMMPFLTVYADLMGIIGGAFVAATSFDITLTQYFNQVWDSVGMGDFVIGTVKSVAYAVLIAVAGCYFGIKCGRSAAAVGYSVTSAVVTSIVYIIVADGVFAVICGALGV